MVSNRLGNQSHCELHLRMSAAHQKQNQLCLQHFLQNLINDRLYATKLSMKTGYYSSYAEICDVPLT